MDINPGVSQRLPQRTGASAVASSLLQSTMVKRRLDKRKNHAKRKTFIVPAHFLCKLTWLKAKRKTAKRKTFSPLFAFSQQGQRPAAQLGPSRCAVQEHFSKPPAASYRLPLLGISLVQGYSDLRWPEVLKLA